MKIKMDRAEMKLNRADIGLDNHETLAISNGAGYTVTCHSGEVWITQEGMLQDHVLGPTGSFVIRGHGNVLVEGYRNAKIQVTAPHRAARGTVTFMDRMRHAIAHFARHSDRAAAGHGGAVFS
jgi:hypothetical protein